MAVMMCHCGLELGWIRLPLGQVERVKFGFHVGLKRRGWYYAIRRDFGRVIFGVKSVVLFTIRIYQEND